MLTNTAIGELEVRGREYEVADDKVSKLKIRVLPSGSRVFYLYYRVAGGKARKYRIGKYGDIGVPAARKAAEKLLAQVALGEDPAVERVRVRQESARVREGKFGTFVEEKYMPWAMKHQKRPKWTEKILRWNFGWLWDKPMADITVRDVEKWRMQRLDEDGVKPATLNRAVISLKAVLNKAVEWEVLGESENKLGNGRGRGLKMLKVEKGGVIRWLNDEEQERLLKVLDSRVARDWVPVIVKLLLWTGMRPIEAFSLRWDKVKLGEGERRIEIEAAYAKSGKFRTVPISDKLAPFLESWRQLSANGGDGLVTVH